MISHHVALMYLNFELSMSAGLSTKGSLEECRAEIFF